MSDVRRKLHPGSTTTVDRKYDMMSHSTREKIAANRAAALLKRQSVIQEKHVVGAEVEHAVDAGDMAFLVAGALYEDGSGAGGMDKAAQSKIDANRAAALLKRQSVIQEKHVVGAEVEHEVDAGDMAFLAAGALYDSVGDEVDVGVGMEMDAANSDGGIHDSASASQELGGCDVSRLLACCLPPGYTPREHQREATRRLIDKLLQPGCRGAMPAAAAVPAEKAPEQSCPVCQFTCNTKVPHVTCQECTGGRLFILWILPPDHGSCRPN
jgi:hypothetical protein